MAYQPYSPHVRVFLDIGSHRGETVVEVEKAQYGFDRIVCFEPASCCWPALDDLARTNKRVEICKFGLGAKNELVELYNAGEVGGTIVSGTGPSETVEIVDSAFWFKNNVNNADFVVVKTNCEGAEIPIINRLLDENLFGLAVTFLVTFDIRDFPAHRIEETKLRARLKRTGLKNFCFADDVMIGTTHERRIAHWLHLFGIDTGQDRATVERLFAANFRRYSQMRGLRHRWEQLLKDRLRYSSLPEPVKMFLRYSKRRLGLSRERDVPRV